MTKHYTWPAKRRPCSLNVFLPLSIFRVKPGPLLRTLLVERIARACAIFRVSTLVVINDLEDRRLEEFVIKVFRYILTPPYLRKRLFPLDEDLRYVGLLSPLAIPTHLRADERHRKLRLGYVVSRGRRWILIDVGLERPCRADYITSNSAKDDLVWVEVLDPSIPTCRVVDKREVDLYNGFILRTCSWKTFLDVVNELCSNALLIEFTKEGDVITSRSRTIIDFLSKSRTICTFFGSSEKDFNELLREQGMELSSLASNLGSTLLKLNTAPMQGVRTIRTEEALYISLALLNAVLYDAGICT